jgi:hypothetical protein
MKLKQKVRKVKNVLLLRCRRALLEVSLHIIKAKWTKCRLQRTKRCTNSHAVKSRAGSPPRAVRVACCPACSQSRCSLHRVQWCCCQLGVQVWLFAQKRLFWWGEFHNHITRVWASFAWFIGVIVWGHKPGQPCWIVLLPSCWLAGSHFVWRAEWGRQTDCSAILIECSSILLTLNSVTPQNTPRIPGDDAHAPVLSRDTNQKALFSTVPFLGTAEPCIIMLKPVIYVNCVGCLGCDSV